MPTERSEDLPGNVERTLGIILGKLEGIDNRLDHADESRGALYTRIDDVARRQTTIEHQVTGVINQVASVNGKVDRIQQTNDDITTLRQKAAGAGIVGTWLLKFGGWLLGSAATLYAFYSWIIGRPPP